jgi:hypothetical protein
MNFPKRGRQRVRRCLWVAARHHRQNEEKRKNSVLGLPVRHGPALALVYTATLAAWVWAICDAASDGLAGQRSVRWIADNDTLS